MTFKILELKSTKVIQPVKRVDGKSGRIVIVDIPNTTVVISF